jgi:hypothetical protein
MRWGLLLLVGCSGPTDAVAPDGAPTPDGSSADGPTPGSRLTIAWSTTPASPGITTAGNRLDDVRFRMESLKAIVDLDPNDPSTSVAAYKLHWDGATTPASITFDNAPAGRYTSIVLQLDDGDNEKAFDIRGEADGETFKIDDSSSLSISMSCDAVLEYGSALTLQIDIDLGTAIDPIEFDGVSSGDGVDHHLGGEPQAMEQFRSRLQQAFRVN